MKKLLLGAAVLLLSASLHAQELPTTVIKDLNTGKKVAFNETIEKGKVTLISFWATWCIPCKAEINHIRKKLPEWKKEVDFNYMTVSTDESSKEGVARTFATNAGWDFPYYIDPNGDLKRSLNFQLPPYLMIIDKNGKVAYTHLGYEEGGEAEIFAKLKEIAAGK